MGISTILAHILEPAIFWILIVSFTLLTHLSKSPYDKAALPVKQNNVPKTCNHAQQLNNIN